MLQSQIRLPLHKHLGQVGELTFVACLGTRSDVALQAVQICNVRAKECIDHVDLRIHEHLIVGRQKEDPVDLSAVESWDPVARSRISEIVGVSRLASAEDGVTEVGREAKSLETGEGEGQVHADLRLSGNGKQVEGGRD